MRASRLMSHSKSAKKILEIMAYLTDNKNFDINLNSFLVKSIKSKAIEGK